MKSILFVKFMFIWVTVGIIIDFAIRGDWDKDGASYILFLGLFTVISILLYLFDIDKR